MKFIDLIKEDEETRQYKKAQTVYKALRKGSATVSVNVAYIEKNGVESHTFEYILPKENYKINVVNLRGNTSTHIRCEKMIIFFKKKLFFGGWTPTRSGSFCGPRAVSWVSLETKSRPNFMRSW